MNNHSNNKRLEKIVVLTVFLLLSFITKTNGQDDNLYPPYTKWYQDPFGLKPFELSTAMGFIWGSAAIMTSLLLTKKDTAICKRLSLIQENGFGFGYKPPYTNCFQNETGVLYKARKWLSVGLTLNAFHFKDRINNTFAFGFRPFARWHAVQNNKMSLFFEYGAGVCYNLKKFPLTGTGWETDTARTGTKFNMNSKYGIGLLVRIAGSFSLQAGLRHFHLSNGNLKGIERNPSHDSNGFVIGMVFSPVRRN